MQIAEEHFPKGLNLKENHFMNEILLAKHSDIYPLHLKCLNETWAKISLSEPNFFYASPYSKFYTCDWV